MKVVTSHKTLPVFSLENFSPVAEVANCEGLLLGLWREKSTEEYFFSDWVSQSGDINIWLLYPLTKSEMSQYFQGMLSRNFFLESKRDEMQVLYADSDWNIRLAEPAPDILPEKWLPQIEDFFDPADCPDPSRFSKFLELAK